MKKYFQSTAYIICLFAALYALHVAMTSYENPFDFYENPLVVIILVGVFVMVVMKEVLSVFSLEKSERLELEKQGIDPATVDKYAWVKELLKRWTKSKAIEEEEEIILDHDYDGIRELDNSLPPWWLGLFYVTILFGVVYLVRFHVVGDYNQAEEYQQEVAMAQKELDRKKALDKTPKIKIEPETAKVLTDEAALSRGKAIFNLNCASCHAKDGGGGIGPNLTDEYWILGGGIENVFRTIRDGGRSGKGMVPWKAVIKSEDIEKVSSYVLSMQGKTPKKPKAPQGEIWEEE